MDALTILKTLTDYGFQTLLTGFFFFFLYKYIDQKFFGLDWVQKTREIHAKIGEEENKKSKARLKKLQLYLEEHWEEIFSTGVDRVSVWLNHNGMRNWKIHFIFYSLVAEITKQGLVKAAENPIGNQKLPYYIFADYEERLMSEGSFFIRDTKEELKGASRSIASDLGTKSMVCSPILSLGGNIDGIIFFSSAYQGLDERPNLQKISDDIRILFIS